MSVSNQNLLSGKNLNKLENNLEKLAVFESTVELAAEPRINLAEASKDFMNI